MRGKSASERVFERVSERVSEKGGGGFQRFSEGFRGFQGFQRFLDALRGPLRAPFSSQSCGPCCPSSCCPLKLLHQMVGDIA